MRIEIITATTCLDCPFRTDSACDAEGGRDIDIMTMLRSDKRPDWCPLRRGPILVQLKPDDDPR